MKITHDEALAELTKLQQARPEYKESGVLLGLHKRLNELEQRIADLEEQSTEEEEPSDD